MGVPYSIFYELESGVVCRTMAFVKIGHDIDTKGRNSIFVYCLGLKLYHFHLYQLNRIIIFGTNNRTGT